MFRLIPRREGIEIPNSDALPHDCYSPHFLRFHLPLCLSRVRSFQNGEPVPDGGHLLSEFATVSILTENPVYLYTLAITRLPLLGITVSETIRLPQNSLTSSPLPSHPLEAFSGQVFSKIAVLL